MNIAMRAGYATEPGPCQAPSRQHAALAKPQPGRYGAAPMTDAPAPPRSRAELMAEWRTLIPVLGIRGAARSLGINEDTACSWAHRLGITDDPLIHAALAKVEHPSHQPAVQAGASNGLQAMAASMREDAIAGRASGLRLTRRGLARLEREDDDALITPDTVEVMSKLVKTAAVAGGYNAGESVARVSLTLAGAAPAGQPAQDPAWIDGDFTADPT